MTAPSSRVKLMFLMGKRLALGMPPPREIIPGNETRGCKALMALGFLLADSSVK
jgi:hypothetical protein